MKTLWHNKDVTLPIPLSRVSTVDALVASLRSRILAGELPPGTHLSEVELATAYGVGRHSLRAAFRDLARVGLLVHEPNRGVFVPVPDAEASADLFRCRAALELGALRIALDDGAPLDGAREPLARLEAMADDEPWDRVAVVHDEIHRAIVDAAGSRRLSDAYAALQGELLFFVTRIRPLYTVRTMREAHRRLVDALASGDAARAERALHDDLAGGRLALHAAMAGRASASALGQPEAPREQAGGGRDGAQVRGGDTG
jgi:DNA-binding GntR family transcriptional regulator